MKKLHPSSAAFMIQDSVITEYSSGCLRQILLSSNGIRTDIPETYARVGAAHEAQHEQELLGTSRVLAFDREVVIKLAIEGFDDILFSGRADFICQYDKIGEVIHETKGTISKNTRLAVIRKQKPKVNQLAQLVAYMIARQTCYGKLVCAYYEEDEQGELEKQEEHVFRVQIADDGAILVDDLPSGFAVAEQIAHRTASAEVITAQIIADRPAGWEQKWGGPCSLCTFKDTCNRFDAGHIQTVEDFVASARKDVEIAEINKRPDPQPFKVKRKKVKTTKKGKKQ
jgi:hypothetical protein